MPILYKSKGLQVKKIKKKRNGKYYAKKGKPKAKLYSEKLQQLSPEEKHKLKGHSHNPLASYNFLPDKAHFINKDPQEKVLLLLRKHPVTNVRWILISFVMIISFPFAAIVTPIQYLPNSFQLVIQLVWYLFVFAIILEGFLGWFFNVNLVTDERIVEVDFVNLIYREITDADIDDIQDVTVQIGGAIRTFFNYGDLIIQTASEVPRIVFESIPNPDDAAKILRELRVEEEEEKLEGRVR